MILREKIQNNLKSKSSQLLVFLRLPLVIPTHGSRIPYLCPHPFSIYCYLKDDPPPPGPWAQVQLAMPLNVTSRAKLEVKGRAIIKI